MTIGTQPLTPEATWLEIEALVNFLAFLNIEKVEITYGWGCHATGIDQPVKVPLSEIESFLHKNIAQGIYHLGEDNLYIVAGNPALKINLCHDADIHFEADDKGLEAHLQSDWEARGHRVWATKVKS